jgi:hypothetical protein
MHADREVLTFHHRPYVEVSPGGHLRYGSGLFLKEWDF